MDEADAGIELRIARETFPQSRHADQDQTNFLHIKNRAYLLQARHPQAIRLIDHDEGGRIANAAFLFAILPCDLTVSRLQLWHWPGKPVAGAQYPLGVLLVALSNRCQSRSRFQSQGPSGEIPEFRAGAADLGFDWAG